MSENVIATLVVPFGGSAKSPSGGVIAEWDDTMNLDASGQVKLEWQPGDGAYLLVYHDHTARIVAVKASAGTIGQGSTVTLQRDDLLGWPEAGEAQAVRYVPNDVPALEWFGNRGREVAVAGKEITVRAGEFPCLARCVYQVRFTRYLLKTPAMALQAKETFPIRVFIYYQELAA